MYCQKCGSELPENAKFCNKCGQALNQAEPPKTNKVNTGQFSRYREKLFRHINYNLTHVFGLPVMPGAICNVISKYYEITIESQGTVLTLDKNRITYIGKENNIQKYSQAISSIGGAVGGAMLFGGIGAAIGGRAKSRNFQSKKQYLVITYIGDDESVKYVIFDYTPKAQVLINDFKLFNKSNLQKRNVEIK